MKKRILSFGLAIVIALSLTACSSSSSDDADIDTTSYTDSTNGFTITYPEGWTTETTNIDEGNVVEFHNPSNALQKLAVATPQSGMNQTILDLSLTLAEGLLTDAKKSSVTIDGESGTLLQGSLSSLHTNTYYLLKGSTLYIFSFASDSSDNSVGEAARTGFTVTE